MSKGTLDLNDIIDQMNLTDIYRTLHPNIKEYTFFSETHRTFSKIDYILVVHKASLNKYKKIEIMSCMLPDHSGVKQEINIKRNYRKYTNS